MNPVWHFVNGVPTGGVMAPSLVLVGDGSAAAPSYSFASDPDTGMWRVSGGVITGIDGVGYAATFTNQFQLATGGALTWSSGAITAAADVSLSRGAANRLDLASGDSFYVVSGGLGVNIVNTAAGTIALTEQTAPSAPAANGVILYAVDNGGGKTQLMALFSSGAAQQLAIQP